MLVWYAAYGSNLLRTRFLTYLRGGPVPGSARHQDGARDPSDPLDDRPYRLPLPLVFGRSSSGWGGGGVCFAGPHRDPDDGAMGRAWLITVEQLADVWCQENGATLSDGPEVDLGRLVADGEVDFGRGWYRRLVRLGDLDGHPVATFTSEAAPAPNPAHRSYLEVVGRGLMETWGLPATEAARYLADRPGNAGEVDPEELADVCHRSLLG